MAGPSFWKNVLRGLGAAPVLDPVLRGVSGRAHGFRALGVDPVSGMTLAVLTDADERLAALVHHDVSAASTTPVLVVRPVAVDMAALAERLAAAGGIRISNPSWGPLLHVWRELILRNAARHPITPLERLVEALRAAAPHVKVRGGALHLLIPDAPASSAHEGVWDFPLYRLTDAQIGELADYHDDDAVLVCILASAGIRRPPPATRAASPGLLLNRHRPVAY